MAQGRSHEKMTGKPRRPNGAADALLITRSDKIIENPTGMIATISSLTGENLSETTHLLQGLSINSLHTDFRRLL